MADRRRGVRRLLKRLVELAEEGGGESIHVDGQAIESSKQKSSIQGNERLG